MYKVISPDDEREYLFTAKSPLHAIQKMLYYLNIWRLDKNAAIRETKNGYALTHSGKEYWIRDTQIEVKKFWSRYGTSCGILHNNKRNQYQAVATQ